jgi:DNA-binding transcriptional ArsR family regulator
MKRVVPFYLHEVRQVTAVASPVRAAVIDVLEVVGPATIVQLAAALGYPPDGLYYHLRVLEKIGLVVRTKPDRDARAARFDLPGRPATLRYRLDDRQQGRAMAKVVATMVRSAERSFRRAFAPGLAEVNGPHRNLRAGRRTAWLTPGELRVLNRYVEHIHALFARGRPQRTGARLHEFTYVLAPIVEKARKAVLDRATVVAAGASLESSAPSIRQR